MQIVVTDKIREFEFTEEEGGGKLFFNVLPKIEYLRIIGAAENIRRGEQDKIEIDTKGLSKKEIKELEFKEQSIAGTNLILNNAVKLICDTNSINGWQGFENEDGKELEFSQEFLRSFIKNLDIVLLTKITMAVTDNFYTNKKKAEPKTKKKKPKTNSKT